MKPARIAIFASGEGTTADAFIQECAAGHVQAEVVLLICNMPKAGIFARIERLNNEFGLNIAPVVINGKTHPAKPNEVVVPGCQTEAEQQAILDLLNQYHIDLIALMGFMKRVGPKIVARYGWHQTYASIYQAQMVNTHPGLLPETKGLYGVHVQEHVIAHNLPFGGQTLHVVAEEYDDGPTIAENKVAVIPDDTPDSLFDRVRTTEKAHIGSDINNFIIEQNRYKQRKES